MKLPSPSLLKKISFLALPVMLSNLLQTTVTAIDTLMIGQLGPIPIAAVGLANTVRFFILIAVLSVAGGAISLAAQVKGSSDPKRLSLVTRQSIVAGLMLAILLGAIGYIFSRPLLGLLDQGGEVEAVELGTSYLHILFLGTPFLVLNIITNRLMQGAGDTLTPLLMTIAMLVLNVAFNYVFIFGWGLIPALGMAGAAYGTLLSRALLVVFALWLFHSKRNVIKLLSGTWRPDWQMIKDILSIGVPSGIQGIFRHMSRVIILGIVTATSLGTFGAAVIAIGTQVEQLIIQPIVGMNVAATSLVGQDIGRWQVKAALEKGILLTFLAVIVLILLVLPVYFFAEELIYLFDPSAHPLILEGSLSYFKISLWSLIIGSIGVLLTGAMRGAGDTKPAMYSALINRNVLQLAIGWTLAFPLGFGYVGIWWGIAIGRILDSMFLLYIWKQQKWTLVALRKTPIYRQFLQHLSPTERGRFLTEVRTPLMQDPNMKEHLETNKVIYQLDDQQTIIAFDKASFRILS